MLVLLGVAVLAVFMGERIPAGFIPQEDQGYLFVALQLPDASSLQRTDEAVQQVSAALLKTPGIEGVVGVDGFSLLTQTQSTNTGVLLRLAQELGRAQIEGGADRAPSRATYSANSLVCRTGWRFPSRRRRFPASAPPAASP